MSSGQGAKLVVIGGFLAAAIGVAAFALSRGGGDEKAGQSGSSAGASSASASAAEGAVSIDFLYSTEKKVWIKEVVQEFQKANPDIRVNLKDKGSLDAVRDVLDGKEKPTLWSPADSLAINLLGDDWFQKERNKLFAESGDDAPQPLVLTPLVFVAWEERGKVLAGEGAGNTFTWKRLHQVLASPEGWKAIGGRSDWGLIRLGHTDPTKSNSGIQALLLMAYEYHNKTSGLQVADVVDKGFQDFMKKIESAVPKFGDSTGSFMNDMILYGPSKYDVVVAYENLAIEQLPNAQGRWGNLKIYYPSNTLWSSHPVAILEAPWVTEEQKAAARKLIAYLRSPDAQRRALRSGFRPSDPSIPILGQEADNPFNAAKAYGVTAEVPNAVEVPPGPVIHNLSEVWSRPIGRQ